MNARHCPTCACVNFPDRPPAGFPPGTREGPCAACGRPVIQIPTGAIVDAEPNPDGDCVLSGGRLYRPETEDVAGLRRRELGTWWQSHLFTCPEHLNVPTESTMKDRSPPAVPAEQEDLASACDSRRLHPRPG
jgi:hypothetical protein